MSITKPPPAPRTKSGQHPAVQAFRAKLESIADGDEKRAELDHELEEFLKDLKTPLPPKPEKS